MFESFHSLVCMFKRVWTEWGKSFLTDGKQMAYTFDSSVFWLQEFTGHGERKGNLGDQWKLSWENGCQSRKQVIRVHMTKYQDEEPYLGRPSGDWRRSPFSLGINRCAENHQDRKKNYVRVQRTVPEARKLGNGCCSKTGYEKVLRLWGFG